MLNLKQLCLTTVAMTLPIAAVADINYYLGAGVGGARVERNDINLRFDEYTQVNVPGIAPGTFLPPYDTDFRGQIVNANNAQGLRTSASQPVDVRDPEGSDFSFKVFGGVRVGRYFGVEAGYINMGEADARFGFQIPVIEVDGPFPPPPRPLQDRQIDIETKTDGFQGYLVGFLPLNDSVELFAKAGVLVWDQDTLIVDRIGAQVRVDQPSIPEIILGDEAPDGVSFSSIRTSDSGTDLALGAGINLRASEHVSLRAELEWFDIDTTSLAWAGTMSLVFNF
ncbi:MAG: outer membrane beta-barrel protein [Gammaproteobacteria bacterium]